MSYHTVWVEDEEDIMSKFLEHYKDLYTSVGRRDMNVVLDVIPELVDEEMNMKLIREVEESEIMEAVYETRWVKGSGT